MALLIDALLGTEELYTKVKEVTDKELKLLITHGHPDHAGKAVKQFAEAGVPIYMNELDKEILTPFCKPYADKMINIENGMMFDIGDYSFEAVYLPGHTAGSFVFLDDKRKLLFSGDAIGSGHFWMQLPMCLPMKTFSDALDAFSLRVKDFGDITIYPGHLAQSPVPLSLQYIEDVKTAAHGILDGSLKGQDDVMDFIGGKLYYAHLSYGLMANFCYDPKKLFENKK